MSNRRFCLTVYLNEGLPDLRIEVLEEDWYRFSDSLRARSSPGPRIAPLAPPTRRSKQPAKPSGPSFNNAALPAPDDRRFITVKTVDDRYIMLRAQHVQAVRSSTDGFGPPDAMLTYDGPTQILLRGQRSALEVFPPDDATIGDMVMSLEHGPDVVPWVSLVVDDGDELFFSAEEVVYVVAATSRVLAAYGGFISDSGD